MGMPRPKTNAKKPDNKDWYNERNLRDTRKAEKMFHVVTLYEQKIIGDTEITEDITDIEFITVYALKNKTWTVIGYRCLYCSKTIADPIVMKKHTILCKDKAEINTIRGEQNMPVQVVTVDGQRMYRWGNQGKLYRTREEAEAQAQAIYASGYEEDEEDDDEE
jgi:hypothetical protein